MSILVQIRLPDEQVARLDALVKRGVYATRSEAIRDAVRRNVRLSVGVLPDTGESVEEVRAVRRQLSKMNLTADELNDLDTPLGELRRRRSAGRRRATSRRE